MKYIIYSIKSVFVSINYALRYWRKELVGFSQREIPPSLCKPADRSVERNRKAQLCCKLVSRFLAINFFQNGGAAFSCLCSFQKEVNQFCDVDLNKELFLYRIVFSVFDFKIFSIRSYFL